ncbi:uncharacterized protein LOC132153278 [Carassius carassius]|uniref:uncharacterized protein LOC132153278 n=1 Tax=Carassius carassius TaxID=217509 RepID=UPI0028690A81|nr:uncharacterized protein LOC132153278 [Carassius carassius]
MSDEERPTVVEQYERCKRKRRTIRSSTTRLLNQIDVELLKEDKDIDRVWDMLAVLSAMEDSLRELDSIVEKHTSLEDVEAEIELAEEYRDRVIEMKARAHRVIRENETMMPDDMALEYSRHRGDDDEWNVPNVLKFLQKEVQSRERTLQMMKSYNQRENQSANKTCSKSYSANDVKSKKPSMPSAAALHIADQKMQNCLFCDSTEHKSEKYPVHPVSARKEKLKKLSRCFVCLGTKHIARFCRSKCRSCATCRGRHHAAICEKNETSPPAAAANIDTVISSVIPQAEQCKPAIENTVLLQTAKAWVVGPTSRKMVRCLLDGGSQGSFVHENVVKALQLPVTRQGTLTLHTFGSSAPTTVSRNIVKLSLKNVWDNRQGIEIEAVVTPKVCTALMKVPG